MLTVTPNARRAVQSTVEHAEVTGPGGLRISADPASTAARPGRPSFRLTVVPRGFDDDERVELPGAPPLYLDPDAAPLLEDKVLDGDITPGGMAVFKLVDR